MLSSPSPVVPRNRSVWGYRLALLGLAVFCVGCDQASKRVAAEMLKGSETLSYWGGMFRLTYAENSGAFLGMGGAWPEPLRWLAFTGAALVVVAASLVWVVAQARHQRQNLAVWAMVLVAAGGAGNLVDRIVRDGRVIDFMNFGLGSVRTGIFNVADVQIMVGLGLLLLGRRELHDASQAPA